MTRKSRGASRIDDVLKESFAVLEKIERLMAEQLQKLEQVLIEEGIHPDGPTRH